MTDENYEDEYNTDNNRFLTSYLTWICLLYVKELTTTKITLTLPFGPDQDVTQYNWLCAKGVCLI